MGQKSSEKDVKKIERNLSFMKRGPVKKIWDKVEFLWGCFKNANENIPKECYYKIIGALIYLVSPLDLVPDAIPFAGLADDVFVINYVYKEIKKFLGAVYEKYEKKAFDEIDIRLQKSFIGMLIKSGITALITAAYVLIKVLQPFNDKSDLVASIILAANAVWFVTRCSVYICKYGKFVIPCTKQILKTKNLRNGIISYIRSEVSIINKIYIALKIVNKVVSEIPAPEELVDTFIKHYKKRVILGISFVAAISVILVIPRFVF
ncbi:MAG: DUF1232 domain-containing protein [Clostridia bacterium]|nr:DUF1232 domain-containing protein [Clostridia bacterium]